MEAIFGSVKMLFGSIFGSQQKTKRGGSMHMVEDFMWVEDLQYDCETRPIDIAVSVNRPRRRDVRSIGMDNEELERLQKENEDEEFSSTEEELEPSQRKRRKSHQRRRKSRPKTCSESDEDCEVFLIEA